MHLQHTLQTDAEQRAGGSSGTVSPRFTHDFSRIPVSFRMCDVEKTMISKSTDEFEQQADRISEQVMRPPGAQLHASVCANRCACKTKQPGREHGRVRTKRIQPVDTGQIAVPPIVHEVIRSSGQPLDLATRAYMERRFGYDFSEVRVHSGAIAGRSAQDMNAYAYTVGHNIVFALNRFAPNTYEGRRLLAHELTHVVQSDVNGATDMVQRQPASPSPRRLTCDVAQKHFLLQYEGEPEKARCMDIMTDPEFASNLFDANIASAEGIAVEGTTWENVEYDRFRVMFVHYKNAGSEYFMLNDVPDFYYGRTSRALLEYSYLKRRNGLLYPVYDGQIYFSEILTPNMLAYKNGLKYQIRDLADLYVLLQAAGAFAGIVGTYGLVEGFKTSLQGFKRSRRAPAMPIKPPAFEPYVNNNRSATHSEIETGTFLDRKAQAGELSGVSRVEGAPIAKGKGRSGDYRFVKLDGTRISADLQEPTTDDAKKIIGHVFTKSGQAKVVVVKLGQGTSGGLSGDQAKTIARDVVKTPGISIDRVLVTKGDVIIADSTR
jgi:hypothetical protein